MRRIIVYAEGESELGQALKETPGAVLWEDVMGPAHKLIERMVEHIVGETVEFFAPFRIPGKTHKPFGSDLLKKKTLRRLLSDLEPYDLSIVLVDADGEPTRKATLQEHIKGVPGNIVIAVARQEFESWLLADFQTLANTLGASIPQPSETESMKPGNAKIEVTQLVKGRGLTIGDVFLRFASDCDLDRIRQENSSFSEFYDDLGRALAA